MERVTNELYDWLQSHDIDPDKVSMVLHSSDRATEYELMHSIKQGLTEFTLTRDFMSSLRGLKLNGIAISLTSDDPRRDLSEFEGS